MQQNEILNCFDHPQLQPARIKMEKVLNGMGIDSDVVQQIIPLLERFAEAKPKKKPDLAREIRGKVDATIDAFEHSDLKAFREQLNKCGDNKKDALFGPHTKIEISREGIIIKASGVVVGIIRKGSSKLTDDEFALIQNHFRDGRRGDGDFRGDKINEFFRDWFCIEVVENTHSDLQISLLNGPSDVPQFIITQWRNRALNIFLCSLNFPKNSDVIALKKQLGLL